MVAIYGNGVNIFILRYYVVIFRLASVVLSSLGVYYLLFSRVEAIFHLFVAVFVGVVGVLYFAFAIFSYRLSVVRLRSERS